MIEVWHRGREVKIQVGDQTMTIDQDDVPALLQVALHQAGKRPAQIARAIGRDRISVNAKLHKLRQDGAL